ncbi:MAG: hypothetical protein AAF530_10825 [Pseudomonadota bacterium]
MPLPAPVKNVPRDQVGDTVDTMLIDPNVGDVDCERQEDGNYTVTPRAK